MSKSLARELILVLSTKGIPFTLKRELGLYYITFPPEDQREVRQAIGARTEGTV